MIDLASAFKVSLGALRTNKMRSALTALGIIIGVAAVITMLAVGTGARIQIGNAISSIGSDLLIILPGSITSGGVRLGAGTATTLTLGDSEAIVKECPAVADDAPLLSQGAQVVFRGLNWPTQITGTTPGYLDVRDWPLAEGRSFTQQEMNGAAPVALLGQTVVTKLFGDMLPIGQVIRIEGVPFTVIGILAVKGQSPSGQDQDDTVLIPITTAMTRLFGTTVPGMVRVIMVKAKSTADIYLAQAEITALLRQRHHLGPGQAEDFTIRNLTQIMQTAEQFTSIMTIVLASIASISLIVGGIGIMNIMLVSVTERTREIGIRMAVGAKTWDIRVQFIIEALTLSLIGGAAGIIIGVAGSIALSLATNVSAVVTPFSILLSFGFSFLVGIFFGFYPAYKASLLNPIDALRYE